MQVRRAYLRGVWLLYLYGRNFPAPSLMLILERSSIGEEGFVIQRRFWDEGRHHDKETSTPRCVLRMFGTCVTNSL